MTNRLAPIGISSPFETIVGHENLTEPIQLFHKLVDDIKKQEIKLVKSNAVRIMNPLQPNQISGSSVEIRIGTEYDEISAALTLNNRAGLHYRTVDFAGSNIPEKYSQGRMDLYLGPAGIRRGPNGERRSFGSYARLYFDDQDPSKNFLRLNDDKPNQEDFASALELLRELHGVDSIS